MSTNTIRYAKIMENDVVDGEGVCVSFWTQGCPHHCKGCHNPQTWDFNGGLEESKAVLIKRVLDLLVKNGVKRNLSILGGEPLCTENKSFISDLVKCVRQEHDNIKIFLWTGYKIEDLDLVNDFELKDIMYTIDTLIDGPYVEAMRDITLPLRGSTNQRVLNRSDIMNKIALQLATSPLIN